MPNNHGMEKENTMKKLSIAFALTGLLAACEDPLGTAQTRAASDGDIVTTAVDDNQDRDQDHTQTQGGRP